jgi:hypothetical protein
MRVLIAAAIVLSLGSVAFAQAPAINLGAFDKKKDQMQQLKEEEIDRAYRDATQNGKGAAPVSNDPWAAVRAAEQPAPKPAKPMKSAAKPKQQAQTQTQQQQSPWPATPR